MSKRQVMMATVLAVGGASGWLADYGRTGELFAQTPRALPTSGVTDSRIGP